MLIALFSMAKRVVQENGFEVLVQLPVRATAVSAPAVSWTFQKVKNLCIWTMPYPKLPSQQM